MNQTQDMSLRYSQVVQRPNDKLDSGIFVCRISFSTESLTCGTNAVSRLGVECCGIRKGCFETGDVPMELSFPQITESTFLPPLAFSLCWKP